ncbi:MAG: hypothetical protein AAFU55_08005, partial [Pseudomonadota bacterium]
MFYEILFPLSSGGDVFNLFRYITFRSGGAFFTALMFAFIFGKPIIDRLRRMQGKGQPIRDDGPQSHIIEKAGTPTMGGVMILAGVLLKLGTYGIYRFAIPMAPVGFVEYAPAIAVLAV